MLLVDYVGCIYCVRLIVVWCLVIRCLITVQRVLVFGQWLLLWVLLVVG